MFNNGVVRLIELSHQYIGPDGLELQSVSRFFDQFEPDEDWDRIAYYTARKRIGDRMGISDLKSISKYDIEEEKEIVLQIWDDKKQISIDHGNRIHQVMEDYFRGISISSQDLKMANSVFNYLKGYFKIHTEEIVYDLSKKLSGTADLIMQRQRKADGFIDFGDYKTNISKGIEYDSIYNKNGKIKHLNKRFKSPIEHLEFCNYNLYALKTSMYAYLAEKNFNAKIGKLFLLFIDVVVDSYGDYKFRGVKYIPFPYLKLECELLLNLKNNISKSNEVTW